MRHSCRWLPERQWSRRIKPKGRPEARNQCQERCAWAFIPTRRNCLSLYERLASVHAHHPHAFHRGAKESLGARRADSKARDRVGRDLSNDSAPATVSATPCFCRTKGSQKEAGRIRRESRENGRSPARTLGEEECAVIPCPQLAAKGDAASPWETTCAPPDARAPADSPKCGQSAIICAVLTMLPAFRP